MLKNLRMIWGITMAKLLAPFLNQTWFITISIRQQNNIYICKTTKVDACNVSLEQRIQQIFHLSQIHREWFIITGSMSFVKPKIDDISIKSLVMVHTNNTVEPIFNNTTNNNNHCYKDRSKNPRFFLYLSHSIYFCNKNDQYRFPPLIKTTRSGSTKERKCQNIS